MIFKRRGDFKSMESNPIDSITPFFRAKSILFLIALILLVLASVYYLVIPKLEQEHICWSTASVLDDDALYQNAMKSDIRMALDFLERKKSLDRSCGNAIPPDCGVWTAPPLDNVEMKKRVKSLITQRVEQYEKLLGIKRASYDDEALKYHQENNNFIYLHNLLGKTIIFPSDCCRIASAAEVDLIQYYPNVYVPPKAKAIVAESLPESKTKFFIVNQYTLYDISVPRRYLGVIQQISEEEYQKKLNTAIKYETYVYQVNACGTVQSGFGIDQLDD